MAEGRPQHGTFRREHQILMRMVERHQRGTFLPGHQIHTQVEVGAGVGGIVGAAEEVEEVGVATAGEARHPEGRTTIPTIGRRTHG